VRNSASAFRTWLRFRDRAEADRMDAQADDFVDRHMAIATMAADAYIGVEPAAFL